MATYNGWVNRQTWNVVLWLDNDYSNYLAVQEWLQSKAITPANVTYKNLIEYLGLQDASTPDGIAWISSRLSYRELNVWVRDQLNEYKQWQVA